MSVAEFVRQNTDPVWLLQEGYYELLVEADLAEEKSPDAYGGGGMPD